ncbi:unnamed protein product [Symbiodinium necroappetens]|uniref:Uncharacterized protein n=1 Tax=Symbiodinium necroappetens TaxID=1628268 RepID=A0A812ZBS7_9DINO|nr:unnamed protein product [Symbiodinium necroappetens]
MSTWVCCTFSNLLPRTYLQSKQDDVHNAHVADAAAGDSESQSDSSSDDSSDSSFAQLKSKKSTAKAAKGSSSSNSDSDGEPEPRASTPVKEVAAGRNRGKGSEPGSGQKKRLSNASAATAAPVNKRAKKKTSAAEAEKTSPKVKESGEAYFALLHELTPDVLWRSCVRTAEVERRLGRLSSIRSSLEKACEDDPDIAPLLCKIENEALLVDGVRSISRLLRASSSEELVRDLTQTGGIAECFREVKVVEHLLPTKTFEEMCILLGRKAKPEILFSVACLKHVEPVDAQQKCTWSLAHMWERAGEMDGELQKTAQVRLLQAQASMFNDVTEKLRAAGSLQKMQVMIPQSLRRTDFDSSTKLPTAEELQNDSAELSNYENESGFAHTIMMDCQRVLACLAVEDEDEKSRIGVSYFVIVARCSGFSKRLLLAMNSQAEWRTDCAQVEIRKVSLWQKVLSLEVSVSATQTTLKQGRSIIDFIAEFFQKHEQQAHDPSKYDWTAWRDHRNWRSILQSLEHGLIEGAAEVAKELNAKMTQFEAWVNENVLELNKYKEMVKGMAAWMEEKAASHEDPCTEILTSKELVPQKLPDVSDDAIFSRCPLELYRKTVSCKIVCELGSDDPIAKLLLDWRELAEKAIEARQEDCVASAQFWNAVLSLADTAPAQQEGDGRSFIAAVQRYSRASLAIAHAKLLKMILEAGPDVDESVVNALAGDWLPVGATVRAIKKNDLPKTLRDCGDDLCQLAATCPSMETVASFVKSEKIQSDALFKHSAFMNTCVELQASFMASVSQGLTTARESILAHVNGFSEKFKDVSDQASQMQMETDDDTRHDFECLKATLASLRAATAALTTMKEATSCKDMTEKIDSFLSEATAAREQAVSIGSSVLVARALVRPQGVDMKSTMTFCAEFFQVTTVPLPEKIEGKVMQILKEAKKPDKRKRAQACARTEQVASCIIHAPLSDMTRLFVQGF